MINNKNVSLYFNKKKGNFKNMAKDKKKTLVPKSSLIIRLIAGGYLIYLAYELFMGLNVNTADGASVGVSIAAAVLFVVCGLILVIINGRDFLKGNFQGGVMDVSKEEDISENV